MANQKLFSVFVSSTFQDLEEERKEVVQTLLESDCFPIGMEMFQASDSDSWSFIQKVIDGSDIYIVIVAGRYGSIHPKTKQSYTEMEYRYALERGIPILGFLHKYPETIPLQKSETDPVLRKKLEQFKTLVKMKNCRFFSNPFELAKVVSTSIPKTINSSKIGGWIRADSIIQETREAFGLSEQNKKLLERISVITQEKVNMSDRIAILTDEIAILTDKTEMLTYETSALTDERDISLHKMDKLKEENNQLCIDLINERSSLQELKQQNVDLSDMKTILENELSNSLKRLLIYIIKLNLLSQKNEEINKDKKSLLSKQELLDKELKKANFSLNESMKQTHWFSSENASLESEVLKKSEIIEKLTCDIGILTQKIKEINEEKKHLISQAELLDGKLEKTSGLLQKTTKPNNELSNVNNSIKNNGFEDEPLRYKIMRMLRIGQINEAENIIFNELETNCSDYLRFVAYEFYDVLRTYSDKWLKSHNYSKEEIKEGLECFKKEYEKFEKA